MSQIKEVKLSNNKEYILEPWTTRKVYNNLFKLGKIFAPVSATLTEAMQGGERLSEVIPASMLYLCGELEDDGFERLFGLLTSSCTGEGGQGRVDLDELSPECALELMIVCLEFYFSSFFKKGLTQLRYATRDCSAGIGEGVKELVARLDVEVVAAEAATLEVTPEAPVLQ